jgi:hypothetical protein
MTVARAEASSSCAGASTPSSARNRFRIRSMKKLPPMKVWRLMRSRSSPSTEAIRVGSATSGMWHDWQLRSSR